MTYPLIPAALATEHIADLHREAEVLRRVRAARRARRSANSDPPTTPAETEQVITLGQARCGQT